MESWWLSKEGLLYPILEKWVTWWCFQDALSSFLYKCLLSPHFPWPFVDYSHISVSTAASLHLFLVTSVWLLGVSGGCSLASLRFYLSSMTFLLNFQIWFFCILLCQSFFSFIWPKYFKTTWIVWCSWERKKAQRQGCSLWKLALFLSSEWCVRAQIPP